MQHGRRSARPRLGLGRRLGEGPDGGAGGARGGGRLDRALDRLPRRRSGRRQDAARRVALHVRPQPGQHRRRRIQHRCHLPGGKQLHGRLLRAVGAVDAQARDVVVGRPGRLQPAADRARLLPRPRRQQRRQASARPRRPRARPAARAPLLLGPHGLDAAGGRGGRVRVGPRHLHRVRRRRQALAIPRGWPVGRSPREVLYRGPLPLLCASQAAA
mmetsp:Transcript_33717/g.112557  ORF Transcript_33717/g.112557 Transcript_33717/m.112557 type:complete len:215 (+) Transcript_33717:346-990(+)